ncbi:hypothetical protein [Mesorhizobium sp. M0159]|uniref:hypothetical protein n=1 Tax=Mesorhizobium sp. M0159 TaxID=2956900 RepID=UPI00333D3614
MMSIKEGDRVVCIDFGTVQSIDENDNAEVVWDVSGCAGDVDLDRLRPAATLSTLEAPAVVDDSAVERACEAFTSTWANEEPFAKAHYRKNMRAALSATLVATPPAPTSAVDGDVANLLTNCAQILDVVKGEWSKDGSWSAWDQSVRDGITSTLAQAAPATMAVPGELVKALTPKMAEAGRAKLVELGYEGVDFTDAQKVYLAMRDAALAPTSASAKFPPTACNAWEDCASDGLCHDPQGCGGIGSNTSGSPVRKPLVTEEWAMRMAEKEGDSDPTTGRRLTSTINPAPDDIAEYERLAFEALPQWAQDELSRLRAATVLGDTAVEAFLGQPVRDGVDDLYFQNGIRRSDIEVRLSNAKAAPTSAVETWLDADGGADIVMRHTNIDGVENG